MRSFRILVLAGIAASRLLAQCPAAPGGFEVASIRPHLYGAADFRVGPGGRLTMTTLTLKFAISRAYEVERYRIVGGPAWLETDSYNILAESECNPNQREVMAMLQALLADRCQLKVHREIRQAPVFRLVVTKKGPKLKRSTATQSWIRLYRNTPPNLPGVSYTIRAQRATVAEFIKEHLSPELGCPVSDETGLKGEYDFQVDYAVNDDPSGPPLSTAIQAQLGLKLIAAKGPVEMLVIDHIEKPTPN